MKFLNKYRKVMFIIVFVVILITMGVVVKQFLYPDDIESIYGSRLVGIEDVKITSDKKLTIINEIKTNENVESASINISGKIINILITAKEGLTIENAKTILSESLSSFSEEEIDFYDFGFFATNTSLKYYLIGSKSKMIENIVWTEYSEVEKNEEE
jgi:predicted nucleotidyltransferase